MISSYLIADNLSKKVLNTSSRLSMLIRTYSGSLSNDDPPLPSILYAFKRLPESLPSLLLSHANPVGKLKQT